MAIIQGTNFIWQLFFVTSTGTSVHVWAMGWTEYVRTINDAQGSGSQ
jgi:hypothetical protein